jgi:hypothetical protein
MGRESGEGTNVGRGNKVDMNQSNNSRDTARFSNFIDIFTYEFFVPRSFRQLLVTCWLWQKNSYKKCARLTLMKLTAGGTDVDKK